VVVEFLDFYQQHAEEKIKFLIFDSRFTTYENLRRLDETGVHFITIRRRGKQIVNDVEKLPTSAWKKGACPS